MSVESLLMSAQKAQELGQYAEAEQLYLQLLDNDFQTEAMLGALTRVCVLSNSIDRAIEYLSRLTVNFPKKIAYCEALASLYSTTQNWSAAANCYAVFVGHNPQDADAHYNCAYHLKQACQYQEAINSYQAALNYHVSQPEEVLTNMAVIYSEHLRLERKAIECLERALTMAPDYIPALFNLATLREEEGDKEKAAQYYRAILSTEPKEYSALIRLAEAQRVTDPNAAIIDQLSVALNESTIDGETRISLNFALGKVLDDCGQYDYAFKHYSDGNRLSRATGVKYSRVDQERLVQENIDHFNEKWFSGLAPISTAEPIFICGMFRSGSTLAEQVLASHSSITAAGERDFFVQFVSNAIEPYPGLVSHLSWSQLQDVANDYIADLTTAFPEASFITDKRPDNFLYLGLIKTLFPKAKIIHSTRQSLDNCLSIYFLRAGDSFSYATDLDDIAHYYKQYQRLMTHWESQFGEDIYCLNYDDLVSDPENETRDLLAFLGLPWESRCLEFHRLKNRVKTASVWQVRQPLYRTSSGRWNNYERHIAGLIERFER